MVSACKQSNLKVTNGAPKQRVLYKVVYMTSEDMNMPTTIFQPKTKPHFRTDSERWQAVVRRDESAEGRFFYSVKTTGVYCRPTCAARLPRRENVRFHTTTSDAERAGFRPCLRCHPAAPSLAEQHRLAIVKACQLLRETDTPHDLPSLAAAVEMSPSHFRRVFKCLIGLTPKAYATAARAERMRGQLTNGSRVTSAVYAAGFHSSSRFYASSTRHLGMTPTNYKTGGAGEMIRFAVGECSLGSILVAATERGICAISLGDDPNALVEDLQNRFFQAKFSGGDRKFNRLVAKVVGFIERPSAGLDLPLDVQGTAFQHRVWQLLGKIPCGQTATYSEIAARLGQPQSVRAVASAVAANQLAVAIPCHRVVRTGGALAGYRWGVDRKAALLKREQEDT